MFAVVWYSVKAGDNRSTILRHPNDLKKKKNPSWLHNRTGFRKERG